jgi:hypothetical protein
MLEKNPTFRVILVGNGEYRCTLHRCKTLETSYKNFNRLKEENRQVIFPKRYVNDGAIKPVKYEIYLVKDIEGDDKNRYVRDDVGRVYEEKPIFDLWTVVNSADYDIEEEFWIYGHPSKRNRKTIRDVVKVVMDDAKDAKRSRQVIVVHNKLVISNEERFDMVICKNKRDCQRLHHMLNDSAEKFKLKGLVFMGTCSDANIPMLYELIHENTGWPYRKIRRTTTRP